ncbi:MAG: acyl-CoA desaturase [Taibaiella sp.]|nr:acyl-CoA desaturase [Taibaiella sp.]
MSTTKLNIVRYAPRNGESFYDTAKKKIEHYFIENNIPTHANRAMKWKTVIMVSLFFVPYFFIVSGIVAGHPVIFFSLWFMVGLGMVGIGCGVHHDSNHGSYSDKKKVNRAIGSIVNLIGAYDVTWRIQHNVLHHTYTNIDGLDQDIDTGVLMRISPNVKRYKVHRFQHIYGWMLYCFLTLQWVTIKDFLLLYDYDKNGLLRKEKTSLRKGMVELTLYKLFYFGYILVLPILYSGMPWWYVVIGFMILHFTAGFLLSSIFQLAHVMETSDYAMPNDDRKMENNWAVHQLQNTCNFGQGSRFFSWFVGGLNQQIEHHLFPHICHVHYPKLAAIVRTAALENGLPYQEHRTFFNAMRAHGKTLKELGRK